MIKNTIKYREAAPLRVFYTNANSAKKCKIYVPVQQTPLRMCLRSQKRGVNLI